MTRNRENSLGTSQGMLVAKDSMRGLSAALTEVSDAGKISREMGTGPSKKMSKDDFTSPAMKSRSPPNRV